MPHLPTLIGHVGPQMGSCLFCGDGVQRDVEQARQVAADSDTGQNLAIMEMTALVECCTRSQSFVMLLRHYASALTYGSRVHSWSMMGIIVRASTVLKASQQGRCALLWGHMVSRDIYSLLAHAI